MAVGHADGAHVVALGEQQFQCHAAVFAQALGVRGNLHAFGDFQRAGRQQLRRAFHLDEAKPARADIINAFEVAERGNLDAGLGRGLQNGRTFFGADLLSVYG